LRGRQTGRNTGRKVDGQAGRHVDKRGKQAGRLADKQGSSDVGLCHNNAGAGAPLSSNALGSAWKDVQDTSRAKGRADRQRGEGRQLLELFRAFESVEGPLSLFAHLSAHSNALACA
jgi:hypothetical protein